MDKEQAKAAKEAQKALEKALKDEQKAADKALKEAAKEERAAAKEADRAVAKAAKEAQKEEKDAQKAADKAAKEALKEEKAIANAAKRDERDRERAEKMERLEAERAAQAAETRRYYAELAATEQIEKLLEEANKAVLACPDDEASGRSNIESSFEFDLKYKILLEFDRSKTRWTQLSDGRLHIISEAEHQRLACERLTASLAARDRRLESERANAPTGTFKISYNNGSDYLSSFSGGGGRYGAEEFTITDIGGGSSRYIKTGGGQYLRIKGGSVSFEGGWGKGGCEIDIERASGGGGFRIGHGGEYLVMSSSRGGGMSTTHSSSSATEFQLDCV